MTPDDEQPPRSAPPFASTWPRSDQIDGFRGVRDDAEAKGLMTKMRTL
jgi:hypothetical protein